MCPSSSGTSWLEVNGPRHSLDYLQIHQTTKEREDEYEERMCVGVCVWVCVSKGELTKHEVSHYTAQSIKYNLIKVSHPLKSYYVIFSHIHKTCALF